MLQTAMKVAVLLGLFAGCLGDTQAVSSEPPAVGPASFAELSTEHIPLRHIPSLFAQRWSAHSREDEPKPHWQQSAAVVLNLLEQMNHGTNNTLSSNATDLLDKLISILEGDLADYSDVNRGAQRELEQKMEAAETAANAATGAKAKLEFDNRALADCYGEKEGLLQKLLKCRAQHGEAATVGLALKSPELCGKDTEIFNFSIASNMVWPCAFHEGSTPKTCRQVLTADLNIQATKLLSAYGAWQRKQKACLMNNSAGDPCDAQKTKLESKSCDGERQTVQDGLASYRGKVQTKCDSLTDFQTKKSEVRDSEVRRLGHGNELRMVICVLKDFRAKHKFTQEAYKRCEGEKDDNKVAAPIDYFPAREKAVNSSGTTCGALQFTLHDGIVKDLKGNQTSDSSTVNHVIFNANVKAKDTKASLYALVVKPKDTLTCTAPVESTCISMETCMDACDLSEDCHHFGVKSAGGADSWWRKGEKCTLTSSLTHVVGFNVWMKVVSNGAYDTTSKTIFPPSFALSPEKAGNFPPAKGGSLGQQCSLLKLAQYRPAGSQSSKCLCPKSTAAVQPRPANCTVEHHANHHHIGRLLAEKHMYIVPGTKPTTEEITKTLLEHCAPHVPCMQRVLCSEVSLDDGTEGQLKIKGTLHIECGDDVQAAHDTILA